MGILEQIKEDAARIRGIVSALEPSHGSSIIHLGAFTNSQKQEQKLYNSLKRLLNYLDTVLQSGIKPDQYCSALTHDVYTATELEKNQRQAMLKPSKYSYIAHKISRKLTGLSRSQYLISREDQGNAHQFQIEHQSDPKKYPAGGFAERLKKGFRDIQSDAQYAIKIYQKSLNGPSNINILRLALRAAYCSQQLGRESFVFKNNNKIFMVTNWFKGVNLEIADQTMVQALSIQQRIVMALNILRELNRVHQLGLLHNDIKASNMMINIFTLNLIDFDSARPPNEVPHATDRPIYTKTFLKPETNANIELYPEHSHLIFNVGTDLYALGLSFCYLFQEILTYKPTLSAVALDSTTLYPGANHTQHPLILKLLKQMIFNNDSKPETTEEYIEAFIEVLKTYQNPEPYLKQDEENTFKSMTVKDAGIQAFQEIECDLLAMNYKTTNAPKKKSKL